MSRAIQIDLDDVSIKLSYFYHILARSRCWRIHFENKRHPYLNISYGPDVCCQLWWFGRKSIVLWYRPKGINCTFQYLPVNCIPSTYTEFEENWVKGARISKRYSGIWNSLPGYLFADCNHQMYVMNAFGQPFFFCLRYIPPISSYEMTIWIIRYYGHNVG